MRKTALLALLCVCGLTQAAQMPVAALPGGTLVYKNVQSIRERKFADIVEQKTDFSCGAAALATVLRQAYWLDVDEEHIIKACWSTLTRTLFALKGFPCWT
jgi:predicted double-glycine peptidase